MGSMFAGIESARMSTGGVYPLNGAYLLEINAVKSGQTRKKIDFFVAEFKILESDNPRRAKGTEMSWMCTMDKEPALGNIKAFVAASTGCSSDDVDEAGVLAIVSAENPLKGTKIRLMATEVTTKSGKPFTRCTFEYVPVTAADVAAS